MTSPVAKLRAIPLEEAVEQRERGAVFVDLRPVPVYLEGHVPASIALHYEAGPGMAARARDCVPLDVPLLLLGFDHGDLHHAAASLRGKGFTVLGSLTDPLRHWVAAHGGPVRTDVLSDAAPPADALVVDVGDPGSPRLDGALSIPVERLWPRADDLAEHRHVAVAAGAGVRAGLAVGMLERGGVRRVSMWQPRRA